MKNYEQQINLYFELKGTPKSSKESYFRRMQAFITFIHNQNKSIDDSTESDIQQYILYLKHEKKLSAGTINNYISGIRWFYTIILEREWNARKIPRMKRIPAFAVVPAKVDVLTLINATTDLKYKAILVLLYGSGLRVSEVAKLKISDICSKSMCVRVEKAKHNTNRYTILSTTALDILRKYFKTHFSPKAFDSQDWLFPGRKQGEHINIKSIKNTLIKLRNCLHLNQNISSHTLRHGFATHALEDGVDPIFIQQMRGVEFIRRFLMHVLPRGFVKIRHYGLLANRNKKLSSN